MGPTNFGDAGPRPREMGASLTPRNVLRENCEIRAIVIINSQVRTWSESPYSEYLALHFIPLNISIKYYHLNIYEQQYEQPGRYVELTTVPLYHVKHVQC